MMDHEKKVSRATTAIYAAPPIGFSRGGARCLPIFSSATLSPALRPRLPVAAAPAVAKSQAPWLAHTCGPAFPLYRLLLWMIRANPKAKNGRFFGGTHVLLLFRRVNRGRHQKCRTVSCGPAGAIIAVFFNVISTNKHLYIIRCYHSITHFGGRL